MSRIISSCIEGKSVGDNILEINPLKIEYQAYNDIRALESIYKYLFMLGQYF